MNQPIQEAVRADNVSQPQKLSKSEKLDINLKRSGLVVSTLGLLFLGWQLWILNEQTATLNRSVLNQEASFSSSKKMDNFDIKRFLLERFTPTISATRVPGEHVQKDSKFAFEWVITNNGSNSIAVSDRFNYDFVRCFNKEYWNGANWEQKDARLGSVDSSAAGMDYEEMGVRFHTLSPSIDTPIRHSLNFPSSAYANFQIGERVAVELLATIFDPDQSIFKEELLELNYRYGTQITERGRPLVFPAIVQVLTRIEMFELTSEGWTIVDNDRSCTDYLLE